jgi:hypothetical protein
MSDQFFEYQILQHFLQQSHSLKLLRSGNAAMCISFLHKVFHHQNQLSLPLTDLTQKLADFLANIGYLEESEEQQNLAYISTDYYDRADAYLRRWADEETRYIYINIDEKTHEPYATLTRHTEKLFQVLELLKEKDFVGTESKLLDLFTKVQALVQHSNENPNERIKHLQEKRKQLEEEIKIIKQTGQVSVFEPWQIKSRWAEIERLSKELSGDFREVEDNFKEIYKTISHRHADARLSKGQLLRITFDALEELKTNDQGKSFYAFWEFLMDEEKQQEFNHMLEELYELLDNNGVTHEGRQLLQLKYMLHTAGIKVLETNQMLGYKLSRIVIEKERGNRRKTKDIMQQIMQHAIQQAEKMEKKNIVLFTDDRPEIKLPLERKPGDAPIQNEFTNTPNHAQLNIDQLSALHKLMDDGSIDKAVIKENILTLLKQKKQISLQQVMEHYGCTRGLAELLAYISVSIHLSQSSINPSTTDDIMFDTNQQKFLQVPQIIFSN